MSNADVIRSMTDEELATLMDRLEIGDIDYSITYCSLCERDNLPYTCDECRLQWLKQDAGEIFGLKRSGGINS